MLFTINKEYNMKLKKLSRNVCNSSIRYVTGGIIYNCVVDNDEDDDDEDEPYKLTSIFFLIMMLIFGGIYFMSMLLLWLRIIYYAFNVSMLEGISSIFVYHLYALYKIGTFINHNTKTTK